jgi:uncharacterized protein (UPF0248 family)
MKKIIISICVISIILMSSGMAMNIFHNEELSKKLKIKGNTLITEFYNNRTIEVDNAGNIVWQKTGLNIPHDGERLSNGNTMITIYGDQIVIEVDSAGNIVWQKTGLYLPMDSERLSNGNTLITEYGDDRVIEVDSAGNIVWAKTGLDDPFDAERLSNGNTLIAETPYPIGRIIEVDNAGNEVWNKTGLAGPVDVERLSNGNTLITEHIGKSVIEVNGAGNIVWAKTGLNHPKDAERLPNGNTLIADCSTYRVIEVDSAGNIVWEKTGLFYPTDVESLFNYPPNSPDVDGPTRGKPGTSYDYTFNTVDPNSDDVKYHIDWDDGGSETTTFNPSGKDVTISHTWAKEGTYIITVYAEDEFGLISPESTFEVTMPRNRILTSFLLLRLLERFPLLERLLNIENNNVNNLER